MAEVKDTELIQVQNLVDHTVGFKDEDTHRRIVFQAHETKKIPAEILRRLYFSYGGGVLLRNYLSVKNEALAREFEVSPDTIEYNWTKENVDEVLTTGSLDELEDALDFGPEGIKDLIVNRAVELKISDMKKREAIQSHTGYNITAMLNLKEEYEADIVDPAESKPKTRRAAEKVSTEPQTRRVTQ